MSLPPYTTEARYGGGASHVRGEPAMHGEGRLVRHADVPTSGVFVGRQSEMGLLRSALAEAVAGSGRCVMLTGEPGIGKTRTCQELVAYAGAQGALALRGRCFEQSGPGPYRPWVQVP